MPPLNDAHPTSPIPLPLHANPTSSLTLHGATKKGQKANSLKGVKPPSRLEKQISNIHAGYCNATRQHTLQSTYEVLDLEAIMPKCS